MNKEISLLETISNKELVSLLRKIKCRGIYNNSGLAYEPYKQVNFKTGVVYPSQFFGDYPKLKIKSDKNVYNLFTSQPNIYLNQLEILAQVDAFLKTQNKSINRLKFEGYKYNWEGRGVYHILPPIIEKHTFRFDKGYLDINYLSERFSGVYIKDAVDKAHELKKRFLKNYHIDEVSAIRQMDIYNDNVNIINYGTTKTGEYDFYVVCDGSHRIDYSLEILNEPINVIVVEDISIPYYALPRPFFPMVRISSKVAENMYNRLDIDKIHLLNNFIKKVLHYDWEAADLYVSKLRSNMNGY